MDNSSMQIEAATVRYVRLPRRPHREQAAGALKRLKRIALREDSPELRRLRPACTRIHPDQIHQQG